MIKLKNTIGVFIAFLLILALVVPAGATYTGDIPVPTPIPELNVNGYNALTDEFIGMLFNTTDNTLDLWGFTLAMFDPYRNILGNWVFIILIFCWIFSLWFRTSNIAYVFLISATVVPLMGGLLFPEHMIIYIILGAVGITAIIYKLVKSRR